MNVLLRTISVLFTAVALFLVYAVVAALGSAGGAKVGVVIGYVIAAVVLLAVSVWSWKSAGRRKIASGAPVAAT